MTAPRQRGPIRLRNRLAWTVVLVLIALGGAGLTTAADRPATDLGRPELTAHADALARPWLAAMLTKARAVAAAVDATNESGRLILGLEPAMNPDQVDAALSAGGDATADLASALGDLTELRGHVPVGLDQRRMGLASRDLLAAIDGIAAGAASVEPTWTSLAADTSQVTALLVAVTTHADLNRRASAAGADSDWPAALDFLAQAGDALAVARGARDQMAVSNDVSGLDELLGAYADYDAALVALYAAVRDGANQDSARVRGLADAVVEARKKLPADQDALRAYVAGIAGATIADEVVNLETARGIVDAAAENLP